MQPGTEVATASGRIYTLGKRFDGGGQAEILTIEGNPKLLAKIYHKGKVPKDLRLRIKHLARAFLDEQRKPKSATPYVSLPLDVIQGDGNDVGILMTKVVPGDKVIKLEELFNRSDLHADYVYCLNLAKAICADVDYFHSNGITVGDLSQANILINAESIAPRVGWVDVDSFGARATNSLPEVIPSGRPPSLFAPELDRANAIPTRETDRFSLGLIVLTILSLRFVHPYVFERDHDDAETIEPGRLIHNETWLFAPNDYLVGISNHRGIHSYPPPVRALARQLLKVGHGSPADRPSAASWLKALMDVTEGGMASMARELGPVEHVTRQNDTQDMMGTGVPPVSSQLDLMASKLRAATSTANFPRSPREDGKVGSVPQKKERAVRRFFRKLFW